MKITKQFLMQGRNGPGGWNKRQLSILGIEWPPKYGWMDKVVGKEIPDDQAKRFLLLKRNATRQALFEMDEHFKSI